MTHPDLSQLSRRQLLAGAAAAGLASAWSPALAKAPMANTQAPSFYRFKLGAFELTAVSDGPLQMGAPQPNVFTDTSKEDMAKVLADNFLPTDNVSMEQNALVVNTGNQLVLIDTGLGAFKMMGNDTGRLVDEPQGRRHQSRRRRRGAAHACARRPLLRAARGRRLARIPERAGLPHAVRLRFLDRRGQGLASADRPVRRRHAQASDAQPRAHRLHQGRARGGHRHPGDRRARPHRRPCRLHDHLAGASICNIGDIAHHHVISVETPRKAFAYDTDGQQGVASRLKAFDMLAACGFR